MESNTATEVADHSASTFSQVVFVDIPQSYLPSTHVTCSYTLNAAFQPNPRDWVGIFKVGWTTTKDYHTFVWVEPCIDVVGEQTVTRQAFFKGKKCFHFCFQVNVFGCVCSLFIDVFVFSFFQDQVEQSLREKAEMQKELDQIKAENETLKSALLREQQQAASLKGQNEQKGKENAELATELDQTKQQIENLRSSLQQQLKENDSLKEEMVIQMTKQMEIQQDGVTERRERSSSRTSEEKYDRAVQKINQLKEEREKLKEAIEAQSEEISKLNAKVREGERELFKAKDGIQLIEVDLQSSRKEKERLAAELQRLQSLTYNVDKMQRENQDLNSLIFQLQILEVSEAMADKSIAIDESMSTINRKDNQITLLTQEKEELARENQTLKETIQDLRRLYTEPPTTPAEPSYLQPDDEALPPASTHIYETIGPEDEESLVCRHCRESFPGITQDELDQHEQCHRVCPFCTMICDDMDQATFEDHVYSH
ncbi:calcium-binding and coiled-coil domain-containing protein 2 [Neolamprologus brichardi]|uniref:calcium-binding and coiled-coil domain-containing protein 2 n=1 Tax=Neolamprologus brichardi TaxID=32507 RepID=UPI00164387E9|nr:calcium-binding and coiled-coil domain-containing protein 2 [Neolamprologus brichardi]